MKLAAHIVDLLRAGTPAELTVEEAKEAARYIDTLAQLDDVPDSLSQARKEIAALFDTITTAGKKTAQAIRMQKRDQRAA